MSTEARVFFSWQSDSPKETNTDAIRAALRQAAKKLEAKATETPLRLVLDEATRDTAGSPDIVAKITEKIDAAQVYVADITSITPPGAQRPCPNPNVMFELGYAVAQLGWDRVILLFNSAIATFPADVPFDINHQRASPYALAPGASGDSGLAGLLQTAIRAVLEKDPKKPAELRGLSKDQIRHQRDVENISWIVRQVHWPSIDLFVREMPHALDTRYLWDWEGFRSIYFNPLFHLYDPQLKEPIDAIYAAWNEMLAHDRHYRETNNPDRHVFGPPGDAMLDDDEQAAWDKIEAARSKLAEAMKRLLDRVRSEYIEVDVAALSVEAFKQRIADTEAAERAFRDV